MNIIQLSQGNHKGKKSGWVKEREREHILCFEKVVVLVLTRLLKHLVTAWLFTIICVVWVGSVVVLEVFDAETVRTSSFSDGCLSFWVVSLAFGSLFFFVVPSLSPPDLLKFSWTVLMAVSLFRWILSDSWRKKIGMLVSNFVWVLLLLRYGFVVLGLVFADKPPQTWSGFRLISNYSM